MSQNVFADSLNTRSFDLYYIPPTGYDFTWRNGMLYNQSQTLYQAKKFQFNTSSVTANGTNAVIHFETNIVSSQPANSSGINQSHFYNLDYINNLNCVATNGNLSILGSSISYARTPWFSNNNYVFHETLTLYGDIALKGFNKDTSGAITCQIGNDDFSFFDSNSQVSSDYSLYFEQNPMSIIWTDNNTDNLLQQQISQTQQLIYQNQQLYNQNEQNTQDIINNQNQNTEDIIKSNQRCSQSPNLIDLTSAMGPDTRITNFPLSLDAGTYTISFKLDDYSLGSLSTFNINSTIRLVNSSPDFAILTINSSTQKNKRYSYTFTINENTITSTNSNIRIANSSYNAGARATLSDIQIEKGSAATEYIPYGSEKCTNFTQEYNDKQYQATDNISNQNSSDIQGAENQATTNLIGVLSGFISAFSNINATNCNLTLEFPDYAGGSRTVNICSGKEKAPRIVEIGSSLLLIGVFVPLAYILIKMIYNEIRSWTNG